MTPNRRGHMASHIGRRKFLATLGGAAAAWPLAARAQQRTKPARIGYLPSSSPPDVNLDSFIRGMGAVGYGQGRDFVIVRGDLQVDEWSMPRFLRMQLSPKLTVES